MSNRNVRLTCVPDAAQPLHGFALHEGVASDMAVFGFGADLPRLRDLARRLDNQRRRESKEQGLEAEKTDVRLYTTVLLERAGRERLPVLLSVIRRNGQVLARVSLKYDLEQLAADSLGRRVDPDLLK